MKSALLRLLAVFAIALSPFHSFAQNLNEQLPLDRIIDQQRLEQQQKKLLEKPKIQEKSLIQKDYKRSSNNCISIKKIEFLEASKLSKKAKNNLAEKILDKCIFNDEISELLKDATNYYIGDGYTNARAYFKGYDPKNEILTILISEGIINSIKLNNIKIEIEQKLKDDDKVNDLAESKQKEIEDNSQNPLQDSTQKPSQNSSQKQSFFNKAQIFFAFPTRKGEIFQIDDIEQGVNNMNRRRSNNVSIDSRPANEEGFSDIIINNNKNPNSLEVGISYDNSGSKSTGVYNTTYSINKDNLFSLNDNIGFSQIKSSRSETNMLNFSAPFGYYLFRYSDSSNKFTSFAGGSRFDGRSTNHDISLSRLIYRDKKHEVNLNTNLNFRNQNSKVNDITTINSQRLSTGRIGADYIVRFKNDLVISTGLTYSKGLKIHGAINDKEKFGAVIQKDAPKAQFHKISYNFNLFKPFKYLNYNLQANGQHSNYALHSSELIFVGGGEHTVRGLQYDGISGSKGGYIRNDLSANITPIFDILKIKEDQENRSKFTNSIIKTITKIQPFIFYDHGFAREIVKADENGKTRYISGAGIGLKYFGKYIDAKIAYAKNLHATQFVIENNEYQTNSIYFEISGKYWF